MQSHIMPPPLPRTTQVVFYPGILRAVNVVTLEAANLLVAMQRLLPIFFMLLRCCHLN